MPRAHRITRAGLLYGVELLRVRHAARADDDVRHVSCDGVDRLKGRGCPQSDLNGVDPGIDERLSQRGGMLFNLPSPPLDKSVVARVQIVADKKSGVDGNCLWKYPIGLLAGCCLSRQIHPTNG